MSAILAMLWCSLSIAQADEWQVVVNQHSPIQQLDQSQVRNLFMGNTVIPGLHVYDSEDMAQRTDFYRQVLGLTESRWRAQWSKLVFTGQATPPQQITTQEALLLLKKSTQAITYLPLSVNLPSEIRVVFVYSNTP